MLRRFASWRGRAPAEPVEATPPDGDKVALVGAALRSTYDPADEELDARLVTLMLELSVEQPKTKAPRRRR
ncbi:hypothetical protein U1769_01235 [Sphingomonas sp. ZT3P38]|uniref:hypothetical protein n=1 Tax=Parasphingomonas zepuensis TaxID=3096161 RepID=UPI002FCAC1E5